MPYRKASPIVLPTFVQGERGDLINCATPSPDTQNISVCDAFFPADTRNSIDFNSELEVEVVSPNLTDPIELLKCCEFVPMPLAATRSRRQRRHAADIDSSNSSDSHHADQATLFVGQVRFDVDATQLTWLFKTLLGIEVAAAEPRGPGCFLIRLRSKQEAEAVIDLNRRLFFDSTGVWFAKTEVQLNFLAEYLMAISRDGRRAKFLSLPKGCVVIEPPRS